MCKAIPDNKQTIANELAAVMLFWFQFVKPNPIPDANNRAQPTIRIMRNLPVLPRH